MVPAALGFGREPDGRVRADLSLVAGRRALAASPLAQRAYGTGATPDAALDAALAAVLLPTSGP